MGRILCFDYGTKRIGVAVSDPLRLTAQNLGTLINRSFEIFASEIADLIRLWEVEVCLFGLPLNMNGTESALSKEIRVLAERLSSECKIPVKLWDERLTTRVAEKALIESGMRREKRKSHVDSVSAVLILQNYLDAHPSL
jgi:putative holliday junction resolvase